jgi:CheY-like chemotaxis protein
MHGAPLRAGGHTALVVEDDLKSAELVRVQLEAEGFQVIHAASAEEALRMAEEQPLALITLDIMLPGMDGWEFLARIKELATLRSVPVVIISIVADEARGFALGAAAVVQKPVSRDDLYSSLVSLHLLPDSPANTLTVLVVDDDEAALEHTAKLMQGLGTRVLRADTGSAAIEAARLERPGLMILSLDMRGLSGFDVVDALSGAPDTARIPVLAVTSAAVSPEQRARLNGSVLAIMDRGQFSDQRLLAEVRRAMSGRGAVR